MADISQIQRTATEILRRSGIAEPRREVNSLLVFALKRDQTFLIAHPEYQLTEDEKKFYFLFTCCKN